jgi:hypothetical protein
MVFWVSAILLINEENEDKGDDNDIEEVEPNVVNIEEGIESDVELISDRCHLANF